MASHEKQTSLFSSQLSDYDSFVEENLSMSPNGPFSDSNFDSSYSSPLGSEMGSPETESEDEVVLAELTRRMAEFAFEDDEDDAQLQKTTHENSQASGLYVKYNSSSSVYDLNHGFMTPSKLAAEDSAVRLPQNLNSSDMQIYRMKNDGEGRKAGFERGKAAEQKEQCNKNMQERRTVRPSGNGRKGNIPNLPLQLQGGGSGMRAVFLGGSNKSSVSSGTGVFLPSGTPYTGKPDPKKKPGCSTVIIPARVLQTLQQHFNTVGAKSQSQNSGASKTHHWRNDVLERINGLLSQQKEEAVFQIQPPATKHDQEELRLPQEWTY